MELPIFSDNLKSSGSWTAVLAEEREAWRQVSREEAEARARRAQLEEMREHAGGGLDAGGIEAAAALVSGWAADPGVVFDLGRLLELHRSLIGATPGADVLRTSEPSPINSSHDPTPAILLPRMLENAFDWFSSDSFIELHPVERASVVYLRLLDLYPFPMGAEPTALLAASFHTERGGFPPLIIFTDEATRARYAQALEAAFRMLTQPLVELFAGMLRRTMRLGLGDAA
ncbi:MAG: Fic family protein [Blastocatellia bacterium]